MLDLYSLFQGKISLHFLVIYFSEQECYILLLQCPAIQYPSPGQTDHQVFILLHCLSRVQMHEIWLNERIPDIRSNHHISQQNAQCTLYPGLFTAHYQKKPTITTTAKDTHRSPPVCSWTHFIKPKGVLGNDMNLTMMLGLYQQMLL